MAINPISYFLVYDRTVRSLASKMSFGLLHGSLSSGYLFYVFKVLEKTLGKQMGPGGNGDLKGGRGRGSGLGTSLAKWRGAMLAAFKC